MARIAYLGPEGTFTEAALLKMAAAGAIPGGGDVTPQPTDNTPAALAAVRAGSAEFACVPIENSIDGTVLPTLDSLATYLSEFAQNFLSTAGIRCRLGRTMTSCNVRHDSLRCNSPPSMPKFAKSWHLDTCTAAGST